MMQNNKQKLYSKRKDIQMKKTIPLLIIIFLIGIIVLNWNDILKSIYKTNYKEYVEKYSKQYNVDPLLAYAIIKAESNFKRNIKSKSGAIGLMQLMEETAIEEAGEFGEEVVVTEKLYNPEFNIKIGTKYYAKLYKKYNNELLALAAYNAGMGKVDKWIKDGIIKEDGSDIENIPIKETNNYVRKIMRNYKIYKDLYK